jgi:solute carrier family 25 S-adenosylmethionine transporter 26
MAANPQPLRPTFTTSLLAGAFAGTAVDLALFPIDTIKTRSQAPGGFLGNGGLKGCYRGVGANIIGSAPGAALFFVTYDYTKAFLSARRRAKEITEGGPRDWEAPIEHMIAASLGEVAACAVRVPTEVVKTRTQAGQHPTSLSALQAILAQRKTIGVSGVWGQMYRGWSVTIMREVPFTVIQFPLWEAMKEYRRRKSGREEINALESGILGSVAGAVAAGFTTPLDVLKTRMMLAQEKTPFFTMLNQILKDHGYKAFFAGIGPRVMWISIGGAIFLGSYQWAANTLSEKRHGLPL